MSSSSDMTLCVFSHVRLFVTPWTVTHQAPLSLEFSRQEYWSVLPCPYPGHLPDPGIKAGSPASQADSLPLSHQESPYYSLTWVHTTTNVQRLRAYFSSFSVQCDNLVPVIQNLGKISQTVTKLNSTNNKWL